MPAEYSYDPETRTLTSTYYGVVTNDDAIAQARAIAGDERLRDATLELVDATGVEAVVAAPMAIPAAAAIKCSDSNKCHPGHIAICAPGPKLAGLARIYEHASRLARLPGEIRVFSTREEAMAWLSSRQKAVPAPG